MAASAKLIEHSRQRKICTLSKMCGRVARTHL